jgi:hypothetical protein
MSASRSCRDAPSFEEYVRGWLYKTNTESADVIYDLVKSGDSLSNSVALTIESLPARKTARLRRLVELFEPYCEWVEDWKPKDWRIEDNYNATSGEVVAFLATGNWDKRNLPHTRRGDVIKLGVEIPSEDVIAAFHGVDSAKFLRIEEGSSWVGAVYRLGRSL